MPFFGLVLLELLFWRGEKPRLCGKGLQVERHHPFWACRMASAIPVVKTTPVQNHCVVLFGRSRSSHLSKFLAPHPRACTVFSCCASLRLICGAISSMLLLGSRFHVISSSSCWELLLPLICCFPLASKVLASYFASKVLLPSFDVVSSFASPSGGFHLGSIESSRSSGFTRLLSVLF